MKSIVISILLIGLLSDARAMQDSVKIPLGRQLVHQRITEAQASADMLDYKKDGTLRLTGNEEVNLQITDAIFRHITAIRFGLETNERLRNDNNRLIGYLRLVREVIESFNSAIRQKKINPAQAPLLIDHFERILHASIDSQSMEPIIAESPYAVATLLAGLFPENKGYKATKKIIYLKYIDLNADKILQTIGPWVNEPFADSLISLACKRNPVQLYSYAQAINSPEGKLIHRSNDSMVKAVANLSQTPNALLYFPFLDDILTRKQHIDDIRKYVGDGELGYDSVGYYKLLVKTAISYYRRTVARDTPIAMYEVNGLMDVLQRKTLQHFVTPINELHEVSNPAVRFRAVEPLDAQDLYYVIVMSEADIYTSSYKYCFEKMLDRLGKVPRSDSLLVAVYFDHFKKFIKMAASYNKLDTFLKTMPPEAADALMKAFVNRLEDSRTNEEAVDVADSYASILGNKKLTNFIIREIDHNITRCAETGNDNGTLVYELLKNICLSATDTTINLTRLYGIPPVYSIDHKALTDDSGRVVEQVFFYGDKDGLTFYPPFLRSFSPALWTRTETKEWVEFRSKKGKPVFVFANKPLDNDTNQDSIAQAHLADHLLERKLAPSILIHRGHSYHLPYTIRQLLPSEKLIILGSCGGYKNLSQVLETCPEAHIVSTKQIGTGDINTPIINMINAKMMGGKKIEWIPVWDSLTKMFMRDPNKILREKWLDYVPPHKNLGALFIKAYARKLGG
jgi:hypothetical protein